MKTLQRLSKPLIGVVGISFALFGSPSARADIVSDLLGNALLCAILEGQLADMPIEPLYQVSNGQCETVIPDSDDAAFFADAQCTVPVTFNPTELQDYCAAANDRETLGNGEGIRDDVWTLTPGNQLDLGARSLESVTQPYVQRLVYRQVQTPRGRCDLEMRVYKSHPAATGQRSMIAFHGGSWTSRSFGFLGTELSVPHFVDQGFVVYAPFYRLLDNTDSSDACNQAEFEDIVEDGSAALDWVLNNADDFGSAGTPVVFGQSAGAHLSLALSVNRPEDVSGAVLMYPPTDFEDFLLRVQSGAYTNPQGLSVLGRVVDSTPENTSIDLPVVVDNSFPQRVASEGGDWPPMFIVHGSADELVESRQSERLCDALAGRSLRGADMDFGDASELRDVLSCGVASTPSSELHLIRQGDHALDVCINELVPDLCLSGGAASRSLVSQSIGESVSFLTTAHQARLDTVVASTEFDSIDSSDAVSSNSSSSSSGSFLGAVGLPTVLMGFLLMLLFPKLRQRLQ